MKNLLILIAVMILFSSCKIFHPCDPDNIMSGKSSQRHDQKKMKASIRIMRSKQYGPFCKVRYENMKTIEDRIYENCDCSKFKPGAWVNIDSI